MVSESSSFTQRKGQEDSQYALVLRFFEKSGFTINDIHECNEYFKDDIDFSIKKDSLNLNVELKVDSKMNKTGNLFLEIISNEQFSTPGSFLKCKAEIFLYYDATEHIGYFFSTPLIQKWFFDIRKEFKNMTDFENLFKLRATHTTHDDGTYKHTTIGRVVNKNRLLKNFDKKGIPYFVKNVLTDSINNDDILKLIN